MRLAEFSQIFVSEKRFVTDLEPDHGELVGERVERLVGGEVLLEPGEGEFHDESPPAKVGRSSGRKP